LPTTCQQAAAGLRQACRKSWQGDYQRKTASPQAAAKGWQTELGRIERRNGGESGSESSLIFHGTPYL
jgi:hypothetical protein